MARQHEEPGGISFSAYAEKKKEIDRKIVPSAK
jgi:hypothetical protein